MLDTGIHCENGGKKLDVYLFSFTHCILVDSSTVIYWTRAPHADANAWLQLHLVNSKSKKGNNYIKILRITTATGMGSPFDSECLI